MVNLTLTCQMGNEDLGAHLHAIGDLTAATKAYGRMRNYCTNPSHIASTSFRLIEVAVDQRSWLAAQSAANKVTSLQLTSEKEQAKARAKAQAAMGLAQMHMQDYLQAARSFVAIGSVSALSNSFSEVIIPNDVAVYGGLCALASMDRGQLRANVLEKAEFRGFLELEPHIRRAINFFCAAKYSQCLALLESYRADYLLDLHLQSHVAGLYENIRSKSIIQYFQPFSCVTLDKIAETFFSASSVPGRITTINPKDGNGDVASSTTSTSTVPILPSSQGMLSSAALSTSHASQSNPSSQSRADDSLVESELARLISSKQLAAKIDLEHRVLVADHVDPRAAVHTQTMENLDRFKRQSHAKLMRMEFLRAGMEIEPPPSRGRAGGDGMDFLSTARGDGEMGGVMNGNTFGGDDGDGDVGGEGKEGGGGGGGGAVADAWKGKQVAYTFDGMR